MTNRIFTSNPPVIAQYDETRQPTLLITSVDGKCVFENVFLMDFNNQIVDDFQTIKMFDKGFQFVTFGRSPVYMTVGGLQPFNVVAPDAKGENSGNSRMDSKNSDVETYFREHSLSSPAPQILTINTNVKQKTSKASEGIYNAYMWQFNKLPNEDDLVQGYKFTIRFVCWEKQK